MNRKAKRPAAGNAVPAILKKLRKAHPEATIALEFANPLQLLVATILSAQCTDKRVNMVTPGLFRRYRSAKEFAAADRSELEEIIRSTGFFRAKAKSIIGACTGIVERFQGTVPATMEELVSLPGVGRKTANVVLGNAFGKAEGVVVDTHVRRIAGRLGFTKQSDPEKIEQDLMTLIPRKEWILFPHLLIWHGRKICTGRSPRCGECPIAPECPSAELD